MRRPRRHRTRAQAKVYKLITGVIDKKSGAIKAPEVKNTIMLRHWEKDLYGDVEVAKLLIGIGLDAEIRPVLNQYNVNATSASEVFGISPKRVPEAMEIENILDLRRADGEAPVYSSGRRVQPLVVKGARSLVLTALGVHAAEEPTDEEIAFLREGHRADGADVDILAYEEELTASYDIGDLATNGSHEESAQYSLWPQEEREFAELLRGHERVYVESRNAHVPLYDRDEISDDEVEEAGRYLIKQGQGNINRGEIMLTLADFRRKRKVADNAA